MLRTKNQVEREVKKILSEIRDKHEQVHAYINIAKLYLSIKEYTLALQYLKHVLDSGAVSPIALTLMGQTYEGLHDFNQALACYKQAFELNNSQVDLMWKCVKICAEKPNIEPSMAEYWLQEGLQRDQHRPVVLQLQESLLLQGTSSRPLVDFYSSLRKSGASQDPVKVALKYYNSLRDSEKVDQLYEELLSDLLAEKFVDSLDWIQEVNRMVTSDEKSGGVARRWGCGLLALYWKAAHLLQHRDHLSCAEVLLELDKELSEERKRADTSSVWTALGMEMGAQLFYLVGCLTLKRAKENHDSMSAAKEEASFYFICSQQSGSCAVNAAGLSPLETALAESIHNMTAYRRYSIALCLQQFSQWRRDWLETTAKKYSSKDRQENLLKRIFPQQKTLANCWILRHQQVLKIDISAAASWLRVDEREERGALVAKKRSLHHIVCLALFRNDAQLNAFPMDTLSNRWPLGTETELNEGGVSRLDVELFFFATIFAHRSEFREELAKGVLPPEVERRCCSGEQDKWWRTVMEEQNGARNIVEKNLIVERGVDAVRLKGRHGMDVELVHELGKYLRHRATVVTEDLAVQRVIEAKSHHYWRQLLELVLQAKRGEHAPLPAHRLFSVRSMLSAEKLDELLDECRMYLGTRAEEEGRFREAIEHYDKVDSAESHFRTGRSYRQLVDQVQRTNEEWSLESSLNSHVSDLLEKTRHYYYMSLDRLRTEPDQHDLNMDLAREIEEVEAQIRSSVELSFHERPTGTPKSAPPAGRISRLRGDRVPIGPSPERLEADIRSLHSMNHAILKELLDQNREMMKEAKRCCEMVSQTQQMFRDEMQRSLSEFQQHQRTLVDAVQTSIQSLSRDVQTGQKHLIEVVSGSIQGQRGLLETVNGSIQRCWTEMQQQQNTSMNTVSTLVNTLSTSVTQMLTTVQQSAVPLARMPAFIPMQPATGTMPNLASILNRPPLGEDRIRRTTDASNYSVQDLEDEDDEEEEEYTEEGGSDGDEVGPSVPDDQLVQQWPHGNKIDFLGTSTVGYAPANASMPSKPIAIPGNKATSQSQSSSTPLFPSNVTMTPDGSFVSKGVILPTSQSPFEGLDTCSPFGAESRPAAPKSSLFADPKLLSHSASATPPTKTPTTTPGQAQVATAQVPAAPANAPGGVFGGFKFATPPKPATGDGKPSIFSGFSFGSSPAFPTLSPKISEQSLAYAASKGLAPMPLLATAAKNEASSDDEGPADEEDAYEPEVTFAPVVELPTDVQLETGEEQEDELYKHRAKLYRFDLESKQWKERGLGDIKLLKHKQTGYLRLLMRREQVHKVCLNHRVDASTELQPMQDSDKMFRWYAMDFADDELKQECFMIKFKTAEIAESFRSHMAQAIANLPKEDKEKPAAPVKQDLPKATVKPTATTAETKTSGPIFKCATSASTETFGSDNKTAPVPTFASSNFGGSSVFGGGSSAGTGFSFQTATTTLNKPSGPSPFTFQPAVPSGAQSQSVFSSPFRMPTPTAGKSIFGSSPGFTFSMQEKNEESSEEESDNEDLNNSTGGDFVPIVTLPEKVDLVTGEEDEDSLFCHRSKLFRYDKQAKEYKERGIGEIKILRNRKNGRVRVLFRREQVLKIACNHYVTKDTRLSGYKDSDTTWTWAALDFADGEMKQECFAVRFKLPETAQEFRTAFETAVKGLGDEQVNEISSTSGPDDTAKEESREAKVNKLSYYDGEVVIVGEEKASKEQRERARKFRLPDDFYLYETRPSCSERHKNAYCCRAAESDEDATPAAADVRLGKSTTVTVAAADSTTNKKDTPAGKVEEKSAAPVTPVFGSKFGSAAVTPVFGSKSGAVAPLFGSQSASAAVAPVFGSQPGSTAAAPLFGTPSVSAAAAPLFGSQSSSAAAPSFTSGNMFNSSGMSFADLATKASSTGAGFAFAGQPTQSFQWAGAGTPLFVSRTGKKEDDDDDEEGDDAEEGQYDPQFEPVIELPEEVPTVTNEENEMVVFESRAKLYRFDATSKEWKERGTGPLKLLHNPDTKMARVLLRREQVHKLACNHWLTSGMELKALESSDKSWCWFANDFADEVPKMENFAARFASKQIADEFHERFNALKAGLTGEAIPDAPVNGVGRHSTSSRDAGPFEKRVTLSRREGDKTVTLGMGELKIVKDAASKGYRIVVMDDHGKSLADHLVVAGGEQKRGRQNSFQWEGQRAGDSTRVQYEARFSSKSAVDEFEQALIPAQNPSLK